MSNRGIEEAGIGAGRFARVKVEWQTQSGKSDRFSRVRRPIGRLCNTGDGDCSDDSDDEPSTGSKD